MPSPVAAPHLAQEAEPGAHPCHRRGHRELFINLSELQFVLADPEGKHVFLTGSFGGLTDNVYGARHMAVRRVLSASHFSSVAYVESCD